MWHHVRNVAANNYLDPDLLITFATENRERYGIIGVGDELSISTWNVDDFKRAFVAELGDEHPSHRERQIALRRDLGSAVKPPP